MGSLPRRIEARPFGVAADFVRSHPQIQRALILNIGVYLQLAATGLKGILSENAVSRAVGRVCYLPSVQQLR